MKQHTVEIGTFGTPVDEKVNTLLRKNPDWHLVALHPFPAARIGGPDHHVLAVFETYNSVHAEFRL